MNCAVQTHCVENVGDKTPSDLEFWQCHMETTNTVNRMLSFININFSFKKKEEIIPLRSRLVKADHKQR